MNMFNNVYNGKRVLVTGHTGFKGSWLSIWLKELGADVIGYALDPPSNPNNFNATGLRERIKHLHGDIRDLDKLMYTFQKHQPEFVFHLAAQPIVLVSYKEPKLTFDTNAGGTINLFEAVRLTSSVKVLVNITSDKCYENRELEQGYCESDPMGGYDPYSASKGCAELIFSAYLKSFFFPNIKGKQPIGAASARAGNVIGGGDWGPDRLVPDCMRALSSNQIIGIRNPRSVRPWQHVLEPLSGYLLLGELLWNEPEKYSGAWNFGPEEESHLTVAAVVDNLIRHWGGGVWTDNSAPEAPHETSLLKLNCEKARTQLNWHSVFSIENCLQMTAMWYRKYYTQNGQQDMYPLCVEQILKYKAALGK